MTCGTDSKFWCFRGTDSVTFWRFLALLLLSLEVLLFLSGRGEGSCASPPPAAHHAASLQTLYHPSGAPRSPGDTPTCTVAAAPSFWSLGVTVGTDKVTLPPQIIPQSHSYQFAYERYLRPRRCEELAFLEIGLGCGMPYKDGSSGAYARTTEGHSIPLWLAYLPRARINVLEYSADCAHAFFNNDPMGLGDDFKRRARLFTGDQSKEEDLHRAMKEMGPQDVIIDDGGHSMMQQQTSLRVLLHYLKPGGVYILEDLQSSFSWQDFNWHDKVINKVHYSMVDYITNIIYGLHWPEHVKTLDAKVYPGLKELLPLLKSVECFAELCVFTRWPEGEPALQEIPVPGDLAFPQV